MSIFPARILLATDGSKEAELAGRAASELATATGSGLEVVHVFERIPTFLAQTEEEPAELLGEARRLLDEEVRTVGGSGSTVEKAHLRQGRADKEIIELAENLDVGLIVVGSRGLGGIRRALMGSVSGSVVRHAHCPVLVVHHEKE